LWNSVANPNGYRDGDGHTDCNRNADCNCDGHTDRNSHSYVHVNSYSYTKTHSNAEAPHHTKAPSDSTASSVTEAKPRKRHGFRHPKDGLYAAKQQLPGFQSRNAEDLIWNPGRQEYLFSGNAASSVLT